MICEYCKNTHDGLYGLGRFCSTKCARGFSTSKKRENINKKVSKALKGYRTIPGGKIKLCDYGCGKEAKHQLKNKKWCCSKSYNKCEAGRKKNSKGLKKSHKNGRPAFPEGAYLKGHEALRKNLNHKYRKLDFVDKPIAEKRRIILKEQKGRCSICNIEQSWNDKPLIFHLDHIDGNRKNYDRNNLRFICPNCHSQTETYCRGSNKNISNEHLKKLLKETNFNFTKTLELANLFPGGYNWNRVKKIANKICQDDGTR